MPDSPVRVLVYSDNARTREQVMLALGKRIHPELPELSYLEVATAAVVIQQMDKGGIDLAILDGDGAELVQPARLDLGVELGADHIDLTD